LNGTEVTGDTPPIIVDGRTLIPVRSVFEAMGGTVTWDQATRSVTVIIQDVNIRLKIDSKTAYINNQASEIDVPAMIINSRSMIPVRFVTEAAGCTVSWDNTNRVVDIVSPDSQTDTEPAEINSIELSTEGNQIVVNADKAIADFNSYKMSNPDRLVLDIEDAVLDMENRTITVAADNPFIKSVRYSQHEIDTVRIVADLKENTAGVISTSDSDKTALITFKPRQIVDPEQNIFTKEELALLDQYDLAIVESAARYKLVVIDAGHGGADTGARGYENGAAVLNEKDVNLDIALRIQDMLRAAGTKIYMIRTTDVTIPLYDRQDTANGLDASLYVSIHNNSYNTNIPNGTEVLYFSSDQPAMDGISGMELAENLQETLITNLGLTDRGAKAKPELAVLRRTNMPAVIIEGAFMSNPEDLNYIKTDEFRELYAKSTAQCIIEALNQSIK
ncbi:MAG: N-acetylmuramoyl-L-alanine amidase family protein, partial [Bacillota bacterium]